MRRRGIEGYMIRFYGGKDIVEEIFVVMIIKGFGN